MARTARPWYWIERGGWYVSISGQRHHLGDHPDGFPAPRRQRGKWNAPQRILDCFHELLAAPTSGTISIAPPVTDVFEQFLEWCEKNRSPRTYEWSQNHIQSFLNSLPSTQIRTDSLKPFHVQQWADSKTTWGANHKRGAITVVQRAFSWAEKMGHIVKSPIRHIEKPAPKRREQMLTVDEFRSLLAAVKDLSFRDVLEFCWETGARVQEVRFIEAAHLNLDRCRIEIPPAEAKGKKRWRIIYLSDRAEQIVRRLSSEYPTGPMFRNQDSNPWQAQAFNNRFCRLQVKLGVKYALTAIRHSFATRMLEAGVDHLTVSALLGHADGAMLAKVYSHVGVRTDFLREELRKVSGGDTAA